MAHVVAESETNSKDAAPRGSLKRSSKNADAQERNFVLSLIKHPRDPVLDVGTGECACLAIILALRGTRVVALDWDHETVVAARMLLGAHHVKKLVRLLQDDITASSLASSSFRNIVSFNVLHHVPRFDRALAELSRILTSDGRLIISDFDENRDGHLERLIKAAHTQFRRVAAYPRSGGRMVLSCEH